MYATRLQLGTSRLEKLSVSARSVFINKSWVHLGDQPQPLWERLGRIVLRRDPIKTKHLYEGTEFREYFFRPGDNLPFEDGSFTFVYSEHFFEHLSSALAAELLAECSRVMKVGGVIRTVVPDAILRTYEPAEAIGHPPHRPEGHPQKHLVRFSLDTLTRAIEEFGFQAVPLDYCTPEGAHIQRSPSSIQHEYTKHAEILDWPLVTDLSYIMRVPSLIVDGIKILQR